MAAIETVRIVKDNHAGYAIINKSDFDPNRHEIYGRAENGPTVVQLKERLRELGVSIPRGASKDDMLALLEAATKAEE